VRKRASEEGVLGRDVSVICWAMGRWMEASGLRARFWCLVEEEFGSEEKRKRSAERWKESTRRKRKRRSGTVVEDGEEAAPLGERDETGNVGEGSKSGKWTRRQLFPHMGRTAMDIVGEGVDLRLEWRVGFDWTGEAESHISASARMPKSCESFFAFYHFPFLEFLFRKLLP
jgi:hypothetical protein